MDVVWSVGAKHSRQSMRQASDASQYLYFHTG
jgi:hypothetical protein